MLKESALLITAALALCFASFGQTDSGGKLLGHLKLVEDFAPRAESKPLAKLIEGFRPDRQGSAQRPNVQRRRVVMMARAPQPGARCGHIIVKSAPAGVDSKIAREAPKGGQATMPVHKGLPACAEDMR